MQPRVAPVLRTSPPAPYDQAADLNFAARSLYISMTYVNGTVIIGCADNNASSNTYTVQVHPGDSPSAEHAFPELQSEDRSLPTGLAIKSPA